MCLYAWIIRPVCFGPLWRTVRCSVLTIRWAFGGLQVSGEVDQSAGMLDESAKEKGYALMCVAEPLSDCRIRVIEEVRA